MLIRVNNGKTLRLVREQSHAGRFAPAIDLDVDEFRNVKRFDIQLAIDEPGAKTFTAIKQGDVISDYRDVRIKGYLSTFKNVTESDRQGDYVEPGAFTETLKRFKDNPVLLTDHRNSVQSLAGGFVVMREDKSGLFFEALLSNAPDVISTRFKVAEGFLKTTSMGGIFHYKEDGRGIFKVELWEGSLTPIPANPDARFNVRNLNENEKKFIKSGMASYHYFMQQSGQ
jgi:HK97 family phage prohead protease